MPETPFFRPNNRNDWILVANAALALAQDDWPQLESMFGSLGTGVVQRRFNGPGVPDSYLYANDDLVVIVIQGTETVGQWIAQLLLSPQVPGVTVPGAYALSIALATRFIQQDNIDLVRNLCRTRKLAIIGHSLGGAIAQALALQFADITPNGVSVMTIGAPRVGNPNFADAVAPFTQRLATIDDPIPSLPPTVWNPVGSAYPAAGSGAAFAYQHGGTAFILDRSGNINPGEVVVETSDIVNQMVNASMPTHPASFYLDLLLLRSDLPTQKPGDQGYPDPPALYESTRVLQGLPISGRHNDEDVPMASDLIQGTLYFRDNNVSLGWTEQIYNVGDVPTMQALLNSLLSPRSLFLSKNMQIHAYRAAVVGPTKLSKTIKLASPQQGQVNEDTNEAGDAILYLLRTAVNSHRQMTFRGLPDSAIGKDGLTPAGLALQASIDAYVQACINGGLCLKVPSLLGLGKQPIQSMNNVVPGGMIEVTTVAAHGFSDGDIVSIAGIRGYPYLLGRWKIQVTSATAFLLTGSERYNISSGRVGTVLGIEYVGQTVTSFGFDAVGHRDTGRPFFQPRGKRSKRVIHS